MTVGRHELVGLIKSALTAARIPLSDEKAAQVAISGMLDARAIAHSREHRLGAHDRPDFFCEPDIVIEVKMHDAQPRSIFRQLRRYAAYDAVGALILVTNRAMGLPPVIDGKAAYYISLGRAWL